MKFNKLSTNDPRMIKKWAVEAVRKLSQDDQITLLYHANRVIQEGGLRGDVSSFWCDRYPELKDKLEDLYL